MTAAFLFSYVFKNLSDFITNCIHSLLLLLDTDDQDTVGVLKTLIWMDLDLYIDIDLVNDSALDGTIIIEHLQKEKSYYLTNYSYILFWI